MEIMNIAFHKKVSVLLLLTVAVTVAVFLLPPIAEKLSYHDFADKRLLWGIPNFFNVISNLPFILIGIGGLVQVKKATVPKVLAFIYSALFAGILLTGAGSAFYHYWPDQNTLVYDRIPMTIVFMSLLAATTAEFVDLRWGGLLLFPLLFIGVISVVWWHHTELEGTGDLRLYIIVQYYPILLIPLILFLFPSTGHKRGVSLLIRVIAWYIIAKIFDQSDKTIYSFTGVISGHSLKHLAAAAATWYLIKLFQYKYS
jgi:hypothetical protein